MHFSTQVSNVKTQVVKKYELGSTQLETDIFSYITFDSKISHGDVKINR